MRSADLDELIAAGNLGLVKAAHAFTGRNNCKFSTYAYTRIFGEIINNFVRPFGARENGRIIWCHLSDVMASSTRSPESIAIQNEREERIRNAFVRLKPKYQELLWAIYVEEISKKQIAADRGCKYQKIVSAERSALNQLRARIIRPNPTIRCACECGSTMLKFDAHWRERRYRHGHNKAIKIAAGTEPTTILVEAA